jgi:isopenicillin N synthase-like dioxygenase
LKEGFYFGMDLPRDHPSVVAQKFNLGPNVYPTDLDDPARFRSTMDRYFEEMASLAQQIIRLLCRTLHIDDSWVSEFATTPIATLRLLHYPPQAPDASELERGACSTRMDAGYCSRSAKDMSDTNNCPQVSARIPTLAP